MERLNYSHLYYFYVVARLGSVTRASAELRLSQPTISTQLSQFEDALGVLLFERKNRSIFLTEIGKRVLDYASEIFKLGAELTDVINDQGIETRIKVQIGVVDSIPKVASSALVQRALAHPGAHVGVVGGSVAPLLIDLKEHKLDLLLSNVQDLSSAGDSSFHHLVASLPVVFVGHCKWAAAGDHFPASAAQVPFLVPPKGTWLRSEIDQYMALHRMSPHLVSEIQDADLLKQLAVGGAGVVALAKQWVEPEIKRGELLQFGSQPFCTEQLWLISSYRRLENPVAAFLMKSFKL